MPMNFIKPTLIILALSGFSMSSFAADRSEIYTQAKTLMKGQDFKPAIKMITKAQEKGEDSIDLSQLLTEAYVGRIGQVGMLKKMGLAKKIKKSMEHSLVLDPGNLDTMEGLVQFHLQAPGIAGGSKDEARRIAQEVITADPLRGHILSARVAGADENYAEARTHLSQALTLSPGNKDIYLGLGGIDVEEEKYADALVAYEKCLEIAPEDVTCRYQLGKAAQMGDIEDEKAIAAFQSVIDSKPDDISYTAYSYYRMGNVYKQNGNMTFAKKNYELALKADDIKPARKALKELEE
jgi:tetratricopeptide (TPR) repeat protein